MEITLSPSVAEAISRGAVVEQLRGRDAFRDDDDASSVCTPAPDDGPAGCRGGRRPGRRSPQPLIASRRRRRRMRRNGSAPTRSRGKWKRRSLSRPLRRLRRRRHAPAPAPPRPLASPAKLPLAREAPAPARPRPPSPPPRASRRHADARRRPRAAQTRDRWPERDGRAPGRGEAPRAVAQSQGRDPRRRVRVVGDARARPTPRRPWSRQSRAARPTRGGGWRNGCRPEPAPQPVPVAVRGGRPRQARRSTPRHDLGVPQEGPRHVVDGRRRTIGRHHRRRPRADAVRGVSSRHGPVPPKLHGLAVDRHRRAYGPRPARPRRPSSAPARRRPYPTRTRRTTGAAGKSGAT